MNTPSTTPVSAMNVKLTIKEAFTSKTFTYSIPNDIGFDHFINRLTIGLLSDFQMSDYELVDVNYRLDNMNYHGQSELAPAISHYDLYVQFINHTEQSRDLTLYIRPLRNPNSLENETRDTPRNLTANELQNVNINEHLPVLFPPVTPDQRIHAMGVYGIHVNVENRYSDNRNNILWEHPLRTGTLYSNICEVCDNSYPSRNYFGCRHTICENCIDSIQSNNHTHCVYCNGFRL